jgi:hypothetical protein
MKIKVACIAACALFALSVSSSAVANTDEPAAKPATEGEQPKALVAAKEPAPAHTPGAQQMKMKHCNEEAKKKELKGDERRTFMSSCLKG